MKVLIVRGFPEKINIQSYNVQEIGLARALRKKGIVCDIVFFGGREKRHVDALPDGTKIFWLPGRNLLKNGIMPGVRKLAKSYDVLQLQEYDQLESWLLYTFPSKPAVIYHGPYQDPFNHGYNAKCRFFDRTFLLLSGRAKRRTICLTKSPQAAEFLAGKGFRHTECVGVGLDPIENETGGSSDWKSESCMTGQGNPAALQLLYVGKLEARRNIPFLLSVIRGAAEKIPVHAVMVGTGEKDYLDTVLPEIHSLEERGILTYLPRLSQKELVPYYRQADVFLFPTNYDIFGMVLLEAMYYGCVCVSSRNGGSATLLRPENGVILDSFDREAWVSAVCRQAEDPGKLSRMKENAAEEIREHYLWDKLADRFADAYGRAAFS